MLWQDWKGKDIADVTEQDIEENEPDWSFMAVGKNYVWDAVYGGELNSLTLAADDIEYSFITKNGQGLDLFDDDEEVQKAVWPEDFEFTGIQSVADLVETIELTERSGYTYYSELLRSAISSAFDMTAWKEVADEETGDVHFVLNDGTKTPDFFYNIFCMDVSKMKGYSSELYFDADAEIATLVLCWNQGTGTSIQGRRCVIDFAVGEDSQLAIFDEASKNLLPPEGADVGPITDELAKFNDVAFRVDWELGYVNYEGEFEPMAVPGENGDVYNASKGVTIADGDTIAYAYLDIDKETGEYVESEDNEYSYGGIYVDTENGGVYALEADDNLNITKPETAIKGSDDVKDINAARNALNSCDMASLTEDLIKGASLSLKDGIYNYTPKFDSLALGSVLSSFVPVYYNSSNSIPMFTDEEIASYCEGTISVDAEKDEITFILCERIRFGSSDEEEEEEETDYVKARLGFKAVLSAPGTVSVDIGDNYRSVLGLDPLPAPETSEE